MYVNGVGYAMQQHHHQKLERTTTSQSTLNSSNNSLYFNKSQVISYALEALPDNLLLRHPSDSVNSLLEHIAPANMSSEGILSISDVADLLHPQHAIITGGRSLEGCPLIIFPDNSNFNMLEEVDYQKLILYLTSVPSLQDADLGFHLIIDRRKDKWASVKTVLQRISVYFPGIIHVVYVLKPCSLLQKAISEVSAKFSKDEYRFRLITCSTLNDLHEYVDGSQLTSDMGGTLIYSHHEWIQQRISLENFSSLTHQVSADLDTYIQGIHDTEFPNSVEATQKLIDDEGSEYEKLKDEILAAAKHGENLLNNIKLNDEVKEISERAGHVSSIERSSAVQQQQQKSRHQIIYHQQYKLKKPQHFDDCRDYRRLLVQLEETERRFDEFWQTHYNRLQQCLELRKFEHGFRELQHTFDGHLKTICDMIDIGNSSIRVDELLEETELFEQNCHNDLEKAKIIINDGQRLIISRGVYPWEIVQPKCDELQRVCNIIEERLRKLHEILCSNRDLMEAIDKANKWCANGEILLNTKTIEKCPTSLDSIEESIKEIETFIASANEFKLPSPNFLDSKSAETKALISEVLQRIDDISMRCSKRIENLKELILEPPLSKQIPEKSVPLQPPGGAPNLLRRNHKVS